jgi:hypothetical protein
VGRLLRQKGAGTTCHVIADENAIDGRDCPLAEALDTLIGRGSFAAVVSCVPGRLGFYKGEDVGNAYILERRG